jgi:hypothetical protein
MMGVPRFYMNVRYRDRPFVDEEGNELADEHAVREHALDTAETSSRTRAWTVSEAGSTAPSRSRTRRDGWCSPCHFRRPSTRPEKKEGGVSPSAN